MDRRTALGTLFATLAAAGVAALIGATAVAATSAYFKPLWYSGLGGSGVGFAGLLGLVFFPSEKTRVDVAPAVNQSVTSFNQSGGQTAHTIVNREPDPVPRRTLSPQQVSAMEAVLAASEHKGSLVEVQFASEEHSRYSATIASVFERSGWKRSTLCIPSREEPHPMRVGWQGEQTPAYKTAIAALTAAGLEFSEAEYRGPAADMSIDAGILKMTAFQRAADKWPE